ncbi:MAG: hypothetical protein IPI28_01165 [Candidatus Omnitrophica bacterium]|nr:hypothetical protein [Candidatus Omnitrophota bacterium]
MTELNQGKLSLHARQTPCFSFLVLLLAAGVRLAGIRFGEPLAVHPHEDLLITDAMEAGARKGHPGRFEYPSGMVYFTLAVQGLHYLFSGADSVRDFWMSYNSHPFEFHLWSRVATVFWALAGIWGIWLLGSEWDRGRTSMRFPWRAGAWLLAVHLLHIRESRFATVDVPWPLQLPLLCGGCCGNTIARLRPFYGCCRSPCSSGSAAGFTTRRCC